MENNDYSYKSFNSIPNIYSDELEILFEFEIKNLDKETFKINFASSVQKTYEYFFNKILNKISKDNFSKNLVFAGGCALNSTANNILINKNFPKKYLYHLHLVIMVDA